MSNSVVETYATPTTRPWSEFLSKPISAITQLDDKVAAAEELKEHLQEVLSCSA